MITKGKALLVISGHIVALLVWASTLLPVYAAISTEPSDLLQFTSAGHVLGFKTDGVYVASGNHMLKVAFAQGSAHAITPIIYRKARYIWFTKDERVAELPPIGRRGLRPQSWRRCSDPRSPINPRPSRRLGFAHRLQPIGRIGRLKIAGACNRRDISCRQ